MKLRMTSISIIALVAVSGGNALAQSDGGRSFCDTGYVQADANSDGMIDKMELKNVTEAEFSALDANGDDSITRAEYTDCLGDWSRKASTAEQMTTSDVEAIDANGDGKVDQGEFMDAADQEYAARWGETGTDKEVRDADMAPATPEDKGGPGQESSAMNSDTSAEDASEKDAAASKITHQKMSDGAQSEQKMLLRRIVFIPEKGLHSLGDMSRDEVAHRAALQFMVLDTDGNKVIDPDEQNGNRTEQADIDDTLNRQFDRADADGSGDLNREEYTADTQSRWQQAQDRSDNANDDVGAPVVYFRYPHTM